jgi:hypothetical protein
MKILLLLLLVALCSLPSIAVSAGRIPEEDKIRNEMRNGPYIRGGRLPNTQFHNYLRTNESLRPSEDKDPSKIDLSSSISASASQAISSNRYMELLAGTDTEGYSGDGGSAASAQIESSSVWADSLGNVYLTDEKSWRIRKITVSTGIITTEFLSSGNFNYPLSIVGDVVGTVLYVSDLKYIWKYTFATNTVTVFAGQDYSSQGFTGAGDGPATLAHLNNPSGLWLTTDEVLYFADTGNNRIRKINTAGICTTVAGSADGSGGFSGDGGPATLATLNSARTHGVYMDTVGRLFIPDTFNDRIRVVNTNNNNIINTFAGTGLSWFNGDSLTATLTNVARPFDVKGDLVGTIYFVELGSIVIRMIDDVSGTVSTLFGSDQSGFSPGISPRSSSINDLMGIWLDSTGSVYFTDLNSVHRGVSFPYKLPSTILYSNLYMELLAGVDTNDYDVPYYAHDFSQGEDNGPATSVGISACYPWVDSLGDLYIPQSEGIYGQGSSTIKKLSVSSGIITTFGGTGVSSTTGVGGPIESVSFYHPLAIVGDQAGTVFYMSDQLYVWKYVVATNIVSVLVGVRGGVWGFGGDNGPASSATLNSPGALWLTTEDVLYIADRNNHRIRRIINGIITTVAGSGASSGSSGDGGLATLAILSYPSGVYMDSLGKLFIANAGSNVIRIVDSDQIISTFAGGSGSWPFNADPDGIAATSATINSLRDVKGDSLGNIYFSEGSLIRIIDVSGIVSTLFGNSDEEEEGFSAGISPRSSSIHGAMGIWLDSVGTVYFTDRNSIHRSVYSSSSTPTVQPSLSIPSVIPTGNPTSPTVVPTEFPSSHRSAAFEAISKNLFIEVVVGTSRYSYSGDGGPATSAEISYSSACWVDSVGNVYIADTDNFRIRKVTASTGIITTFGRSDWSSRWSKESRPIESVFFYLPAAIVGDQSGTFLYIGDERNLWKYEFATNNIFPIAGERGFTGDPGGLGTVRKPTSLWLTTDKIFILLDKIRFEPFPRIRAS